MDIYLCTWHVERCWIDHLHRKVKSADRRQCQEERAAIFKALQGLLTFNERLSREEASVWVKEELQKIYSDFATFADFIQYVKDTWEHKIGVPQTLTLRPG